MASEKKPVEASPELLRAFDTLLRPLPSSDAAGAEARAFAKAEWHEIIADNLKRERASSVPSSDAAGARETGDALLRELAARPCGFTYISDTADEWPSRSCIGQRDYARAHPEQYGDPLLSQLLGDDARWMCDPCRARLSSAPAAREEDRADEALYAGAHALRNKAMTVNRYNEPEADRIEDLACVLDDLRAARSAASAPEEGTSA
jgi:hypothetical protein